MPGPRPGGGTNCATSSEIPAGATTLPRDRPHAADGIPWRLCMKTDAVILALLAEGYSKKTWHGPNLRQSLRGVSAKDAARRPAPGRHNIWELALHAAYWKYAVRRRIEGGKRGSFILKGSNFFPRPEKGKATEAAWNQDLALLETEHEALEAAIL